jgi:hypothetical protein
MDIKILPLGLWVWVCSYNTQTRKPVDFLNQIQPSAIAILFCEFIINLTSLLFTSYFGEP